MLSFSFSSKEMKSDDPLAHVRSRLEDLDIKTIIPYVVDQTTHVVQSKRNTAKGLQALVNGKYIVQNSYIDALVYATTPSDLENVESLSPLETDFDAAWPDAMEHLPPAGKEPISRPAAAFAPNPSRVNIFENYTFVFGDATQFENLQAPITNGQGKALFYEVKDGVTTASDIVQFMRNAGGHKGVVLVRFRSKDDYEQWSISLGNEVALMMDQRVIEQREFLDAILGNDASPLCRPLPREEASGQPSQSQHMPSASSAPPPTPNQPPTNRPKAPRVRGFVSKMKAFDDGFDMESVPVFTPDEEDNTANGPEAMDIQHAGGAQPSQPLDTVEEEAEEDVVANLLPGARAMKRRRAEMGEHHQDETAASREPEVARKPKRPKLDLLEAARKHREEEEQQRRQAEEDSHPAALANVDVEQLKYLAIVEEMELPARQAPVHAEPSSDRWDERWNGRKNFKKFRRKGKPGDTRHRIQTVIVPLEEVTRKDFGIGDHYWVGRRQSPNHSQTDHHRSVTREDSVGSPAPASVTDPSPAPGRRNQKRYRDSDSDDELRFRFRRRR